MQKMRIKNKNLGSSLKHVLDFQAAMNIKDLSTLNQEMIKHKSFTISYDGKDYWFEGCDKVWSFMELEAAE